MDKELKSLLVDINLLIHYIYQRDCLINPEITYDKYPGIHF